MVSGAAVLVLSRLVVADLEAAARKTWPCLDKRVEGSDLVGRNWVLPATIFGRMPSTKLISNEQT